jgi:ABC-type Fe3+ transport system substrate-binding protein
MVANAPHPHAALLFHDYLHSGPGQQVAMKGGLSSARNDIGSLEQKFKKLYMESKYTPEELEKKVQRMGRTPAQAFHAQALTTRC